MDCGVPDTWPPGSPDHSAPHYFFWSRTQDTVCVRSAISHPLPVFGLRTRNIWTALTYRHDKCRTADGALTEGLGTDKCQPWIWSSPILSKHVNFYKYCLLHNKQIYSKIAQILCVFLLLFTGLAAF